MCRCALIAALIAAAASVMAAESVYTWVDADGVTHYAETPPSPTTPVTAPARLLSGDSDYVNALCATSLCEEVLAVDPYCRSQSCARSQEIGDACFTRSCQNTRRSIRRWIAERLERSATASPEAPH